MFVALNSCNAGILYFAVLLSDWVLKAKILGVSKNLTVVWMTKRNCNSMQPLV